jgi:hypothetical protein
MRNDRLSDDEIAALLRGTAPHGRPELEPLATLVDDLRFTSSESSPRPSAAVTALLDADRAPGISTAAAGGLLQRSDSGTAPALPVAAPRRGIASMFITWFTGLGLAAKIALGATAAAVGVVGAGAAHALPPGIQQQFDEVVETVAPATTEDDTTESSTDEAAEETVPAEDVVAEEPTGDVVDGEPSDTATEDGEVVDGEVVEDATGPKTEHAQAVTEAAHDTSTVGREHGKAVSEAAHQKHAEEAEDESADDTATVEGEATAPAEAQGKGKNKN